MEAREFGVEAREFGVGASPPLDRTLQTKTNHIICNGMYLRKMILM